MKKILFIILSVILFLGNFHYAAPVYASETTNAYDKTNVLEDLQNATDFNIRDYPFQADGTPQIINFVEYCYSPYKNLRAHFGLYLYIYNPSGQTLDTASLSNKVQLAVGYDKGVQGNIVPTDYDKFLLQFCGVSEQSDFKNLFYKFKIIDKKGDDGKTVADRVNSHERRYDLSGIELKFTEMPHAEEYGVGGTYIFTGYAKGYGPDGNTDTLTSTVTELETIKLDLHHTSYLAKTSANVYDQLHSVYFSVPQATIAKFGEDLQEIKVEWYEYKTDLIAVLLPEWETRFKPFIGVSPEKVTTKDYMLWNMTVSHDVYAKWAFNHSGNTKQTLHWLLSDSKATQENAYIPSADLLEYMKNYNASYENGKINGKYSADLFTDGNDGKNHKKTVQINANDGYSLLGKEQNGFEKFLNWISGQPTSYPDFEIEKAIEPLKEVNFDLSDSALAGKLYVNEQEIAALRKYCTAQIADGNYPYLFRYAVRDYEIGEIHTDVTNILGTYSSRHIGFGAKETAFLDLDVIYLKFFKNGQYYVIPAVSNPIDAVGGLISPDQPKGCLHIDWLKILSIALFVLFIIVLIKIILKIKKTVKEKKKEK